MTRPAKNPAAVPWRRPTFGGLYYWSDIAFRSGWRLQRHALRASLHRVLDERQRLCGQGVEADCRILLEQLAPAPVEPARRAAVVLLHGLLTSRFTMSRLAATAATEGYEVANLSYATNLLPIERHGGHLADVLRSLADFERVHLVGFSLGGLVIRSALAQESFGNLGRCVMLGTPNQGAEKADRWARWPGFDRVAGRTGRQLGTGPDAIHRLLPPSPPLETAIIAGGRGRTTGYYPLLSGDNDFTVTVDSTRLPGAKDFLLLPCIHGLLPYHRTAVRETMRFLRDGAFSVRAHAVVPA